MGDLPTGTDGRAGQMRTLGCIGALFAAGLVILALTIIGKDRLDGGSTALTEPTPTFMVVEQPMTTADAPAVSGKIQPNATAGIQPPGCSQ
ncbi:MAG: hypothetical protein R3C44_12365 [Chloroflexota bacterium]